ncbi:MAG: CDP-glycerol glycerophosphotransferase family protein [Gammaproteobacteria bacterium]|nr:CDP-glycerol glycerophosphotransferase family protein [Gammaproteobacteria bacterium]MBT8443399.1 CDP-glycerol glycerophosphotransferase family protein [Gammaproteobacteria bacterium]NND36132.1 hypothetical protein [Gammaproteobacteria bacterium]
MLLVIIDFKTLLGVLLRPFMFALYFLSGFTPRSPRRWVFGSWSGKRFADNSAALFEHVLNQDQSGIEAVWISHDRGVLQALAKRGCVAHTPWSPGGILACLTAGVIVFDGLTKDVNHWLTRGAKKVLLRHGVGIKKVERAIEHPGHRLYQLFHGSLWQRAFWGYLLPWHLVRPDLMIATSPEHAAQGHAYYDVDESRIVITGFPRNDILLSAGAKDIDERIRPLIAEARRRELPVFLYMPTFRDDDSRFDFPLAELEQMAARHGIMLFVKLHFVDGLRQKSFVPDPAGNLRLLDPAIDASEVFPAAAGLISDYSSVVFDFVLTEKPVIFFVPDIDEYLRHSRSFYYDFEEITPGPKAKSLDELETAIAAAVRDGLGEWTERYDTVLSRLHTYRDAGASERTYQAIIERFLPSVTGSTAGRLTKSATS